MGYFSADVGHVFGQETEVQLAVGLGGGRVERGEGGIHRAAFGGYLLTETDACRDPEEEEE